MFNLFKNSGKEKPGPEWLPELHETRERWFVFLDKLEARMEELCLAAIPELKELIVNDEDPYKRTFLKVQSGVRGQLANIRQKASDTFEEKVNSVFSRLSMNMTAMLQGHTQLLDFRTACSDRYYRVFEEKCRHWSEQLEQSALQDVEVEYRKILAEFEKVRSRFACRQCGSPIAINRIFFISTYITCTHCRTQNTFEPGAQARSLQHIARPLAEQRTASLYEAYKKEEQLERELYEQNHALQLSLIHERDTAKRRQAEADIQANEQRRRQCLANAPLLHRQYLRAMYDAWNEITPDLKEHNEKMYLNEVQHIERSPS